MNTARCLQPVGLTGPMRIVLRTDAPVRRREPRGRAVALAALAVMAVSGAALAGREGTAATPPPAQYRIQVQHAGQLPVAELGWVRQRDHFGVTIGAGAGQGAELGALLVVADMTLAPGAAFPVHRHAGVDVVSLVIDGTLTHEAAGHEVELTAGSAQAISAGAGILHTEANRGGEPLRMVQLWFASRDPQAAPVHEQVAASPSGELAALAFDQLRGDVRVRRGVLQPGASAAWSVAPGKVAYVLCVGGALAVDGVRLDDGDGATLRAGDYVAAPAGTAAAQLVVIELPAPVAP